MNVYQMLNIAKIKSEYTLLFDLDGTLIDTDLANNAAYMYAVEKITGNHYPALSLLKRITRKDIASLESISEETLNNIIQTKKWSFRHQIAWGKTAPLITAEILKRHHENNNCYIITAADKTRAELLIHAYGLNKLTKGCIFVDGDNKYDNIAEKVGVDLSKIILFEDDKEAIKNAINHGINEQLIIGIEKNTLKKYLIEHNDYLTQDTKAFYSLYYLGYRKPGNPDFINCIKNQFANNPNDQLSLAWGKLQKQLILDISSIYKILGYNELTVVAIPRAKAECEYIPDQQLFRLCVKRVVEYLKVRKSMNLVDGSHFIIRHTNTKTTHLAKNISIANDGDMPYVGITKDTCTISEQVKGKDILLIDDIYTRSVNIDEDAIQALYDSGACSVAFYSVCRTV